MDVRIEIICCIAKCHFALHIHRTSSWYNPTIYYTVVPRFRLSTVLIFVNKITIHTPWWHICCESTLSQSSHAQIKDALYDLQVFFTNSWQSHSKERKENSCLAHFIMCIVHRCEIIHWPSFLVTIVTFRQGAICYKIEESVIVATIKFLYWWQIARHDKNIEFCANISMIFR